MRQGPEVERAQIHTMTKGGNISRYLVNNHFSIIKLRLTNLKSIFKTPQQLYSVSKDFSSKHRAVIFRHSSVATTYKVPKFNEFMKPDRLLMHLHHMYNNQLIAKPELHLCHTSTVLRDQRQAAAPTTAVCLVMAHNPAHRPVFYR